MITPDRIMAWAIPGFFILIAIEFAVARWRGNTSYRSNDAINSLGLGVISQVVGVFTKLLGVGVYAWAVKHVGLFRLPADSVLVWISALLLYDFLYYWLHRKGHEVNVLWAAHVVHHQSEAYNLTTALRQTGTGFLLSWVFYLPMALLGYPVEVFVVVALIDLLYQFWVHTGEVGKLGWFDRVFCSPSNHRAHHAVNDRYLDRNYGGILILWDRLFGTFVEEDDSDPPVYGTRSPLRSWNPLWANAEVYWAMAQDAWHARRWRDKLQLWFRPPGWRPADVAERFPKSAFDMARETFNPPMTRSVTVYVLVQFGLLLAMAIHFLGIVQKIGGVEAALYGVYLLVSLCTLGLVMEGRRSAVWLEAGRCAVTAVLPLLLGRWFGEAHLDVRLGVVFAVVFGLSALALPWLGGMKPEPPLHHQVTTD